MNQEQKNKIISFLNDQISQATFRARAYVFDENNKKRPNRHIYVKLNKYIDDFLSGRKGIRWLTLTGLRGSGKTTLMSQFYLHKTNNDVHCLYLSVDQIVQMLGLKLSEVLSVFEELIGKFFENLDKPLLLFLDEVQYDEKWGITLKSLYDRSNKVFIFSTGSAALAMNSNPDIARRTIYEKLFPLSFAEFIKIKDGNFVESGLCKNVRNIIFESQNAEEAYNSFLEIQNKLENFFVKIEKFEVDKYIKYGSLPFMIALKNESLVYDQINKTLDRIINSDVAKTGRFSTDVISKIPAILYAVADMDQINFSKIAEVFEISRPKVMEIFDVLEDTETLIRILPYGSHLNQVKKPSKYLFSSPAFRAMYYNLVGNIISKDNAMGKLLEDTVGMYLDRYLYKKVNTSLTYDSARGGADFIIGFGKRKIIIEVSAGKKDYSQIIATSKKVKANYSIIISDNSLEYSEVNNAIKIPLKYFLLA